MALTKSERSRSNGGFERSFLCLIDVLSFPVVTDAPLTYITDNLIRCNSHDLPPTVAELVSQ